MRDDLLLYYERELTFLRQSAVLFAEKYPKIASRLVLEPSACEDPHVERLLEAFAFLAARVHLKIDDEFPEITEALLGIVYPHFIRPIPSMSIVEFQLDTDQGKLTSGFPIAEGTMLHSRAVGGIPCKFRTCYDTTLWPVSVASAEWKTPDRLAPPVKAPDAGAALRVELRCPPDVKFPQLGMDTLRVYLDGEPGLLHTLYELLCCNLVRIVVRDPTPGTRIHPVTLPASSLRPVGFEPEEAMLPYPRRSFPGYRLLQEFFTFPEKFFFLDITGLAPAWAAGFKDRAELVFLISQNPDADRRERLEIGVSSKTFRLGCAPVINLFPLTADPILLNQTRYEYPVVPDSRRLNATEIFSIESVDAIDPETRQTVSFEPFYSFRAKRAESGKCFWLAHRRPSGRANDDGSDISLSLVDLSLRPLRPDTDTLTVRTVCTNRDLPARLPFGNEAGDFEMEGGAAVKRIVSLKKPTPPLRPPMGKGALWSLISHLSLNYLSLVEGGQQSLQQILRIYNYTGSSFSEKMIQGITGLRCRAHFARVVSENGITFARGTRVQMELDEEQFVGGGVYLFASVLEHFLGSYASLNSFSQLVVSTRQRKEVLREWAPRAGQKILM
ncbi:MAG TPA: type VI secretion system baseplate subunit TssF [Bryobacteraceae bacterium]|nr:type VI secretion system baseplate subunit TssF [Bryobacteraceae bacterium]